VKYSRAAACGSRAELIECMLKILMIGTRNEQSFIIPVNKMIQFNLMLDNKCMLYINSKIFLAKLIYFLLHATIYGSPTVFSTVLY